MSLYHTPIIPTACYLRVTSALYLILIAIKFLISLFLIREVGSLRCKEIKQLAQSLPAGNCPSQDLNPVPAAPEPGPCLFDSYAILKRAKDLLYQITEIVRPKSTDSKNEGLPTPSKTLCEFLEEGGGSEPDRYVS